MNASLLVYRNLLLIAPGTKAHFDRSTMVSDTTLGADSLRNVVTAGYPWPRPNPHLTLVQVLADSHCSTGHETRIRSWHVCDGPNHGGKRPVWPGFKYLQLWIYPSNKPISSESYSDDSYDPYSHKVFDSQQPFIREDPTWSARAHRCLLLARWHAERLQLLYQAPPTAVVQGFTVNIQGH